MATITDESTTYRERTEWPVWANAIYWGAIIGVSVLMLSGYDTEMGLLARMAVAGGIVAVGWVVHGAINGLTVLVQETRLFVHLGSVALIKKAIAYGEIVGLESVTYKPFAEFGGWGRRGVGKKQAWTARGDRAVVLTLTGDRLLYVGSDHPQRLEERIRTTAGDLLGTASSADPGARA
ncbi:MAG: hypothetical protein OEN56_01660 [Gemmatimonadota bacterium]|nr:hypothetical protein [Gemmatimonadota bacterium]